MLTCSHVNFWKKECDSLQQPWSNGATKTFYIKSVNISVSVNPQWTNLLTVTLGSRKQTFHQFLLSFLVCQGLTRQIRDAVNKKQDISWHCAKFIWYLPNYDIWHNIFMTLKYFFGTHLPSCNCDKRQTKIGLNIVSFIK